MTTYHQPVLLEESLDGLNIQPDGTYVDVTFGGGGHSRELLKRLNNGRLIAFDQDADSAANAIDDPRFTLVKHNFRYLKNYLKLYQAMPIDGLLADLGVSSHQFDAAERGFSIRHEAVLDMRMDRRSQQSARKLINKGEEAELARIFREYGELRNARHLAKAIVAARSTRPIRTSTELKAAIAGCIDRRKEQQYLAR
ncbi:MAG: 16S rRNA (cytosine(1402)-N(4))-methyltransferase RsmH, partial [Bacteroidota bacterium]